MMRDILMMAILGLLMGMAALHVDMNKKIDDMREECLGEIAE